MIMCSSIQDDASVSGCCDSGCSKSGVSLQLVRCHMHHVLPLP